MIRIQASATVIKKGSKSMNYEELREQPDGVIFCEIDLPATPMFRKISTDKDDISVKPIFKPNDSGTQSFGLSSLTDAERNSKEFYVLTHGDVFDLSVSLIPFKEDL